MPIPLLLLALAAPPADHAVTLTPGDATLSARVGDRPRTVFFAAGDWNAGKRGRDYALLPKPFFFPLYGPGGVNVVDFAPADHPHHKGVWVAVDELEILGPDGEPEVGPLKHWIEDGRIETVKLSPERRGKSADGPASFTVENHWLTPGDDPRPVLGEVTRYTLHADGLLAADIRLSPAGDRAVTIGDTKEGFFALRVAPQLRAKGGTGTITNSAGATGEPDTWGRPAAWVDYSGEVDGVPVGVALFDHPGNLRPAGYHVRGYGLFGVSPFGPRAYSDGERPADPVVIEPGDELRLRYALFVHPGDADSARVAERHAAWVKAAD